MATATLELQKLEEKTVATKSNIFANVWLGLCFTILSATALVTIVTLAYPVAAMLASKF